LTFVVDTDTKYIYHQKMIKDKFGQLVFSEDDICELYLKNPNSRFKKIYTVDEITNTLELNDFPNLVKYIPDDISIENFDEINQSNWLMPDQYKDFDIAKYVLEKCECESELQRAGEELLLYQEKNLFPLLRYLKYLVDTLRKNNIVWGVGRGSSVSSFVLFLLGVHRINSLSYDLNINEFLK